MPPRSTSSSVRNFGWLLFHFWLAARIQPASSGSDRQGPPCASISHPQAVCTANFRLPTANRPAGVEVEQMQMQSSLNDRRTGNGNGMPAALPLLLSVSDAKNGDVRRESDRTFFGGWVGEYDEGIGVPKQCQKKRTTTTLLLLMGKEGRNKAIHLGSDSPLRITQKVKVSNDDGDESGREYPIYLMNEITSQHLQIPKPFDIVSTFAPFPAGSSFVPPANSRTNFNQTRRRSLNPARAIVQIYIHVCVTLAVHPIHHQLLPPITTSICPRALCLRSLLFWFISTDGNEGKVNERKTDWLVSGRTRSIASDEQAPQLPPLGVSFVNKYEKQKQARVFAQRRYIRMMPYCCTLHCCADGHGKRVNCCIVSRLGV
uniref:Secreted protein n=2 Tax=Panagrellus redivivus TaxID=6233 RepID=A0A7E4ZS87_PANRE